MADTEKTPEIPKGWLLYSRQTPDGKHWMGEHYGPHGFTARLGDATREGLVAKIVAREEYRIANGFEDRPPTALRSTP